jgi:hypothetical protein
MDYNDKLTEIFFHVDEFCLEFDRALESHLLAKSGKRKYKERAAKMSDSEIMTILILFHLKSYRNLKHFYLFYVKKHLSNDFPTTVSYNRFVELQQKALLPMVMFLKTCCLGKCTGISFIDSTRLPVCDNKRIHNHKVFNGIAERGKCTMGWFYGFKLHLVINDKGEILNFMITRGNIDDREAMTGANMLKDIFGKLFGDKGYISEQLVHALFVDGIHLITKIKRNMKNRMMKIEDKILLRKRALIESVNDELKNICQIEHTRHRSFVNFITNIIGGMAAYSFMPKKPAIACQKVNEAQLALF